MILQIRVHYGRIDEWLRQEVMRRLFITVIGEHAEARVAPEGRVFIGQLIFARFPL